MGAQWKTKIKETTAAKGRIFTKLAKEIMVAAHESLSTATCKRD